MQEKAAETLRYVHFQVKYEIEAVVFLSKLWVLFVFNIEKRVRGVCGFILNMVDLPYFTEDLIKLSTSKPGSKSSA